MLEEMKNEIEAYAKNVGVTVDEAEAVFSSIATDNGLDLNNLMELKVARSVFRSKYGQAMSRQKKTESGDTTEDNSFASFSKKATGFFYSVDGARNWQEYRINQVVAEYNRDANAAITAGKCAVVVLHEDGYEFLRANDGEIVSAVYPTLPEGKAIVEVDDDKWVMPLDDRATWGSGDKNPNFGKPIDEEAWTRKMLFLGKVGSEEYELFTMSTKGKIAQEWNPNTFEWCEFTCVRDSRGQNALYAKKDGSTVSSYTPVESDDEVVHLMSTHLTMTPLVALETYHTDAPKYSTVITDGNVSSMNLNRSTNGNATIYISDLNADFDYDGEGRSSTPCWVPEHIKIDFGIGSNVIVIGRTSQREVDGELTNMSVNVSGIYVVNNHGSVSDDAAPAEDGGFWWD